MRARRAQAVQSRKPLSLLHNPQRAGAPLEVIKAEECPADLCGGLFGGRDVLVCAARAAQPAQPPRAPRRQLRRGGPLRAGHAQAARHAADRRVPPHRSLAAGPRLYVPDEAHAQPLELRAARVRSVVRAAQGSSCTTRKPTTRAPRPSSTRWARRQLKQPGESARLRGRCSALGASPCAAVSGGAAAHADGAAAARGRRQARDLRGPPEAPVVLRRGGRAPGERRARRALRSEGAGLRRPAAAAAAARERPGRGRRRARRASPGRRRTWSSPPSRPSRCTRLRSTSCRAASWRAPSAPPRPASSARTPSGTHRLRSRQLRRHQRRRLRHQGRRGQRERQEQYGDSFAAKAKRRFSCGPAQALPSPQRARRPSGKSKVAMDAAGAAGGMVVDVTPSSSASLGEPSSSCRQDAGGED